MGRPAGYQWAPLGLGVDPVPGEPSAVSQEAAHLSGVAKMISDQVAALKKISAGGADAVLEGDYADKIRSSAGDLAGQLSKVVGRYQHVASAMNAYIPDLEHAQSMSLTALTDATGPAAKLTSLNDQTLPSGSGLTPLQQQQVTDHKTALSNATGALNEAKALLHQAISLRDHSASHCASQIRSASSDSMKDHWYTGMENWVDENWAWILKDLCTILEIAATILAIVAFLLIQLVPVLGELADMLVLMAFAATATALAGRLVLALTHNGSWFDVIVDAAACLTFGTGRALGTAMKTLASSSEVSARGLIAGERGLMMIKAEMNLGRAGEMFDDAAKARILTKFSAKVADLVPDLAKVPEEGVSRLRWALGLGGYGHDISNFAKVFLAGQRFAGTAADNVAAAEQIAKIMGITSGTAGSIGAIGAAVGGIVIGPEDHPFVDVRIPGFSQWFDSHIEVPTGG